MDFRELVRDLAGVFRARIELRQIGVRDEAKMIGGLGICGRPFCCSQFLDGFLPVSIKMAKTQNLSLNPTKISGTCGRLMCCLKYEQNAYEDAAKRMPKVESFVQTPDGPGNVKSVDLLRETVKVGLDSAPEPLKCYHNAKGEPPSGRRWAGRAAMASPAASTGAAGGTGTGLAAMPPPSSLLPSLRPSPRRRRRADRGTRSPVPQGTDSQTAARAPVKERGEPAHR